MKSSIGKIEKLLGIPNPRIRWQEVFDEKGFHWHAHYKKHFLFVELIINVPPDPKFLWRVVYPSIGSSFGMADSGLVNSLDEAVRDVKNCLRKSM